METATAWTWKTRDDGERRGGSSKHHAFENATRRSLCRKYDDGPAWRESAANGPTPHPALCCATCRIETARLAAHATKEG